MLAIAMPLYVAASCRKALNCLALDALPPRVRTSSTTLSTNMSTDQGSLQWQVHDLSMGVWQVNLQPCMTSWQSYGVVKQMGYNMRMRQQTVRNPSESSLEIHVGYRYLSSCLLLYSHTMEIVANHTLFPHPTH